MGQEIPEGGVGAPSGGGGPSMYDPAPFKPNSEEERRKKKREEEAKAKAEEEKKRLDERRGKFQGYSKAQ